MGPFYLMESETEAKRLLIKSDHQKTAEQLTATGILALEEGARVIDAGSGIGHVAEVMGGLLKRNIKLHQITLLDSSKQRLSEAKQRLGADQMINYQYLPCDLTQIPLPSESVDYIFCRFVFEYLADPQAVFDELYRIVKPGGKLVVGDLDYNCMTHYPLNPKLEEDLFGVVRILQENNLLDPHAGRKLYSFFHRAQLIDVKVHFYAHHLFYGKLSDADEFNWLAKLDRLIEHQKNGTIQFDFDLMGFKDLFLDFLKSPGRFSYTPLILVEGRKPL
jgi:ubiquinone/menaquinone biosynthesis C-methylase UbiE